MVKSPARSARPGSQRWADGSRPDHSEAASPPAPIPSNTTASMPAKAALVPLKNKSRKRSQTTSSARRIVPARNAAASRRIPRDPIAAGGTDGAAAGGASVRKARVEASRAAAMSSEAATAAVPRKPSHAMSAASPATAPAAAPSVFQP